jgi:hypothetical protein
MGILSLTIGRCGGVGFEHDHSRPSQDSGKLDNLGLKLNLQC